MGGWVRSPSGRKPHAGAAWCRRFDMNEPSRRSAGFGPALVIVGFALLALAGVLGVLSLASAELENTDQATGWATAAFVVGLAGGAGAVVGALMGARRGAEG